MTAKFRAAYFSANELLRAPKLSGVFNFCTLKLAAARLQCDNLSIP